MPPLVLHALPQPPQFAGSVDVSTSQPFEARPSQFAKGAVHVGMEHADETQVSVPPLVLHALPQPPQLFGSVAVFTHVLPQRLGNEALLHAATHVEPLHAVDPPLGAAGHVAHTPGAGPQSKVPEGHDPHVPPPQVAPLGHALPQAPQLFGSVVVFTHVLPQRLGNEALLHAATHVEPLHAVDPPLGAAGHVAHTPGAGPQSKVPEGHDPHVPPPQVAPLGHALPQAPQLFGSVVVFTHVLPQRLGNEALLHAATHVEPLHAVDPPLGAAGHVAHTPGAGPQSKVPEGHDPHVPPPQVAPLGHALPQAPQLFGSVVVFTHVLPQRLGNEALLHAATHVEPLHAVDPPLGAAGHVAHTPGAGPQSKVPEGHDPHVPPPQVAPLGHALPQAPQFFGSATVFTHALPQRLGNEALLHAATHVEPLHAVDPLVGAAGHVAHVLLQSIVPTGQLLQTLAPQPAGQLEPHMPQFFASLDVLTSQPFEARPSQFAKGAVHVGWEQAEETQRSVPPLMLHALPQALQFAGSLDVSTSQPFAGFPSQSALGGVHVSTQALFAQVSVPPAAVQVFPHCEQLFMSLVVLTSQPLEASLSQSAKPALHAVMVHVRTPPALVQASVAWLVLHEVLQSPQWLVVVIVVSQPFLGLLSQSAKPALQFKSVQLPPTQDSVAPPAMLHGFAQPPQLLASVFRLISHPFDALWSQSSKPVLHDVTEQTKPVEVLLHASVAWLVLHVLPHAPQLLVVVIAVSQPFAGLLSQSAKPGAHVILHVDATQVPVPPLWLHAFPHAPQWLGSLVRLISQPFAAFVSQSPKPTRHATIVQLDAMQASIALSVLHARPQPPQSFTLLVVLISQPLPGLPSQSAVPGVVHFDTVQTPPMQTSDALVALHACAQEPQLFESVARLISQPSEASLSQSWKLAGLQDVTEQVDAAHDSTAFWVLHGVAQAPQWVGSVARSTHAALAPPPGGQSVGVPAWGHDSPQLIPSQVATPCAGMGHTPHDAPHELVETSSKQVAVDPTAQLWVPAGQTQFPPWQTAPLVHAMPQAPQFS